MQKNTHALDPKESVLKLLNSYRFNNAVNAARTDEALRSTAQDHAQALVAFNSWLDLARAAPIKLQKYLHACILRYPRITNHAPYDTIREIRKVHHCRESAIRIVYV